MARVLPLCVASNNMFRVALLSVVLTLATGTNAALYCGVRCHPAEGMAGASEHQQTWTTTVLGVEANDDCTITSDTVVFVQEETRRTASAPNAEIAVVVHGLAVTPPTTGTSSTYEPGSRLPLELRPLAHALRI